MNSPYVAFFALGTGLGGFCISKTKLLQLFQLVSGLLSTAGANVLWTIDLDSYGSFHRAPDFSWLVLSWATRYP